MLVLSGCSFEIGEYVPYDEVEGKALARGASSVKLYCNQSSCYKNEYAL